MANDNDKIRALLYQLIETYLSTVNEQRLLDLMSLQDDAPEQRRLSAIRAQIVAIVEVL